MWLRFHGVVRPNRPTSQDAAEVIAELGYDVKASRTARPPVMGGFASRGAAIAFVRKRLCLRPEDDEKIAEELGERLVEHDGLWSAVPPEHDLVTLWWDS